MFNKTLIQFCCSIFSRLAKYKLFPFKSNDGVNFIVAKSNQNWEIFWNNSIILYIVYICIQITRIRADEGTLQFCISFLWFLTMFVAFFFYYPLWNDAESLRKFYGEIIYFSRKHQVNFE